MMVEQPTLYDGLRLEEHKCLEADVNVNAVTTDVCLEPQ